VGGWEEDGANAEDMNNGILRISNSLIDNMGSANAVHFTHIDQRPFSLALNLKTAIGPRKTRKARKKKSVALVR